MSTTLTMKPDGSLVITGPHVELITKDDSPGASDVHVSSAGGDKKRRKKKPRMFREMLDQMEKIAADDDRAEWGCAFEIAKSDDDQNLVFGWANIVEKDGVVVTDSQGDQIDVSDLERAVYDYALFKREAGEMHERIEGVGKMVESLVMTVEKQKALGIPEGSTPLGWWVGFQLAPDVFAKVKDGTYSMFSIGGLAVREQI